jgi:hypothetical protein
MRSENTKLKFRKFMSGAAFSAVILALGLCPLGVSARQGQSQDAPPVMNQQGAPPTMQQQAPITLQKPNMQNGAATNAAPVNGTRPAGPPVTENDLHVIARTREILNSADKWNHADSGTCAPDATTFSLLCALQKASTEVNGSFDNRGAAVQEMRFAIDDLVGNAKHYNSRLTDFNNDSDTTFENVQQLLRNTENNLTEKLAQSPAAQQMPAVPQQVGQPETDPGWHRFQGQPGGNQQAAVNMPPLPSTLTLPAGTMISVRTTGFLSSERNKVGEPFTTTLDQPIVVNGWVVARRGQPMTGRIVTAKKEKGESQLGVELASLTLVDGAQIPVKTELVTNATPNAGVGGREVGGVAATTGVGAIIGGAANGGEGAGIGAGIGAAAGIVGVLLTRGRPTVIPPESMLMFRLDTPLTINTDQSQVAFQPVTQDDYGTSPNNRRPMRPAYGRPGYGYPPPPSAYYYSPYYTPGPYYGYGYLPLPVTFGFGYGFGYGRRFGGFRR